MLIAKRFVVGFAFMGFGACGVIGGSGPRLVPVEQLRRTADPGPAAVPAVHVDPLEVVRDSARRASESAVTEGDSPFAVEAIGSLQGAVRGQGEVHPAEEKGARGGDAPGGGAPARRGRPPFQQGQWIKVDGPQPRVRFSFEEKALSKVMALFANVSGRDIIVSNALGNKPVSATIRDQEWHLALEPLLAAYDLRPLESPSGVITVVEASKADQARASDRFELKHRLAHQIEGSVRRAIGLTEDSVVAGTGVDIVGDPKTSRVMVVTATPERLGQARSLIAKLDERPRTLTIEWRQVEVNREAMQQLGLAFRFGQIRDSTGAVQTGVAVEPAGGFKASTGAAFELVRRSRGGLGMMPLEVFVDALKQDGFGELVTSQTITVDSDETAAIRVGDAFILPNNQPVIAAGGYSPMPFGQQPGLGGGGGPTGGGNPVSQNGAQAGLTMGGYQRFESGTSVRATPYALTDDVVRLDLELVRDGLSLAPDGKTISGGSQTAFTRVTVRNGSPVVIGGLAVNGKSRTNGGIPGLSRLPILGRLFRNEGWVEQQRELLIVVVPRINYDDEI